MLFLCDNNNSSELCYYPPLGGSRHVADDECPPWTSSHGLPHTVTVIASLNPLPVSVRVTNPPCPAK